MTTLVLEHLQHADSASPDITIDSSGRIGIGTGANVTTNAHANADDLVIGNTSTRTGMTIVSDPAQSGAIHFSDGTSTGNANIKGQISYEHSDNSFRVYANSTTEVLRLTSSGGTVFNNGEDINQNFTVKTSGNANALFIDGNGGNVGIGTDDPERPLHVKGANAFIRVESTSTSQNSQLEIKSTAATWSIGQNQALANTGTLEFYNGSSSPVVIKTNGNVGISATNPTAKLHLVDGNNIALMGDLNDNSTMSLRMFDSVAQPVEVQAYSSSLKLRTTPLGGSMTDRMIINADGVVSMPYQPGFRAYSTIGNISSGAIVQYNIQDWGNGSHYSTGANRFTAPVSGKYAIHFSVKGINIGAVYARIKKNGTHYGPALEFDNDIGSAHTCMSFIGSMNVNDYIEVWAGSNVKVDSADSFSVILIG